MNLRLRQKENCNHKRCESVMIYNTTHFASSTETTSKFNSLNLKFSFSLYNFTQTNLQQTMKKPTLFIHHTSYWICWANNEFISMVPYTIKQPFIQWHATTIIPKSQKQVSFSWYSIYLSSFFFSFSLLTNKNFCVITDIWYLSTNLLFVCFFFFRSQNSPPFMYSL